MPSIYYFFRVFLILTFCLRISVASSNTKNPIILNGDSTLKKLNFDKHWLYKNGDNINYRLLDFDDNSWEYINSSLLMETIKKVNFTGKGWFRLHFKVDSLFKNKALAFSISQTGACEIYFNGKFIKSIGGFGSGGEYGGEGDLRNNGMLQPVFIYPELAIDNVIAIRYENNEYLNSYQNGSGEVFGGFTSSLETADSYFKDSIDGVKTYAVYGLGTFVFIFSVGFIHFLLFIFYRVRKSNLVFSVFCLILSYYFLHFYLVTSILTYPPIISILTLMVAISVPFFFFSLLSVLYSLFYEKAPKLKKYLFIASIISSAALIIFQDPGAILIFILVLVITGELIRVLIVAIRKRKKGYVIISLGFGTFGILIVSIVISMLIHNGHLSLDKDTPERIYFYFLFITAIVSIPLSMSVFLAHDFAMTNTKLSRKLIEIEDLSARSIEQEKEKQKILANQNELLESQVQERTSELNEQKKVVEEKNKDITDSINYAQRIQQSILPSETEIKSYFPESFVLFKPRDIVSGDFYQFKKVDDYYFAILADCTGHGVPGALMSMIGSNLLHQIIVERRVLEPNKILSELHLEVKKSLRQNAGVKSHDGMDISVMLKHKDKIYFASANRPIYLILNNELQVIKPDKKSIGGASTQDAVDFTMHEVEIKNNLQVYMFSDGYADQFGGVNGKKFKLKNLNELLLEIHLKPLDMQHQLLEKTFENWRNLLEQVDDVSMIGIKLTTA